MTAEREPRIGNEDGKAYTLESAGGAISWDGRAYRWRQAGD